MSKTQRELEFGNTDPDWQAFLRAVGDNGSSRAKRRTAADKAITAIREQRVANQERFRRTRP